jgi:hypothetical protein
VYSPSCASCSTAAKADQDVAAVETFPASNTVILALADEPAAGTNEKTPAKSDLELGVETLAEAGEPNSRTRRRCRSATR